MLKIIERGELNTRRLAPIAPETFAAAARIVEDVRGNGASALRKYAEQLDGLANGAPLIVDRDALQQSWLALPDEHRALIERAAHRIRIFADAQRACLQPLSMDVCGGSAGHTIEAVRSAGCYAPGGKYPLISSMLMTVVTAKAAGVQRIVAASPNPSAMMRATAFAAGADQLLTAGGAHAIGALAYGVAPVTACDAVVGPGNRWVTAAKQIVSGVVRIDMLAGPSELLVVADDEANAAWIAADLLAQAEHDRDARPMIVSTSARIMAEVNNELARQLATLPAQETARAALQNGFAVVARDIDEAAELVRLLAPEHLALHLLDSDSNVNKFTCCGALFIGGATAEVFGDYGAGPNHTLPTGGTARFASGLSVFHFLRQATWLRLSNGDERDQLRRDVAALARLEGLEAHARSAEIRATSP
jgi:phosphoribosyl-ATP pyrophosphohydrolase/phosphoribosyl-AMP cyclohydrolase/histidinol dehydrogenase